MHADTATRFLRAGYVGVHQERPGLSGLRESAVDAVRRVVKVTMDFGELAPGPYYFLIGT